MKEGCCAWMASRNEVSGFRKLCKGLMPRCLPMCLIISALGTLQAFVTEAFQWPLASQPSKKIPSGTTYQRWIEEANLRLDIQTLMNRQRKKMVLRFTCQVLPVSASPSVGDKGLDGGGTEHNEEDPTPWSEWQDWALRDNLHRYTFALTNSSSSRAPKQFARWRTLIYDVPELNGYDVHFIRRMCARQQKETGESSSGKDGKAIVEVPSILPLLEQFEFESDGGMSGVAFGLPGIADGVRMRTPPLKDVHNTVPLGYVCTQEGDVAFELGRAADNYYSLDGTPGKARELRSNGVLESFGARKAWSGSDFFDEDTSKLLIKLGSASAAILATGAAMNMLSHHLTVNVFWV